jgi:hypothetical protein
VTTKLGNGDRRRSADHTCSFSPSELRPGGAAP